jgi:hypothetical protein
VNCASAALTLLSRRVIETGSRRNKKSKESKEGKTPNLFAFLALFAFFASSSLFSQRLSL